MKEVISALASVISGENTTAEISPSTCISFPTKYSKPGCKPHEQSVFYVLNLSSSPNGRPISGYYEYETVQHNVAGTANLARKLSSIPDSPTKTQLHPPQQHPPQSWKPLNGFQSGNLGGSGRSRGPYVTQVHIPHSPPSSTSNGGLYNHHNPQSHASKVAERGRLRRGDRILEINGTKLSGLSDTEIQESLKRSLDCSELRVRVIRGRRIEIALIKGQKGLGFSVTSRDNPAGGDCPKYIKSILPIGAAIEDGRLKPGDRLLEVDGESITDKTQTEVVETLKSKKLGSRVVLVVSRQQELVEEEQENEIKEVNERDIQVSQSNVRSIIESKFEQNTAETPSNDLQIKHSKSQSNIKNIIEQLNENKSESQHFIDAGSESTTSNESQPKNMWKNREILSFNIPVHDSEKAGLGISVKGKKRDSGIYINNVINGGAASRDGRLKPSDLILSVNETSLMNQTNEEAMITLRTAMLKTANHPKYITMTVARNLSRANSSVDISTENSQESSNTSENSGATVIYLTPEKKDRNDLNRKSMPLSSQQNNCWRNESYYMATDDTWSPVRGSKPVGSTRNNNSVLIEDDAEPMSPTIPFRPNDSVGTMSNQTVHDATYSSQLSLDTNTSAEHFSRDAIGRRSISEKHHAALDARETGTYQRNKKLREERDRERRLQQTKSAYFSGSMESITTRIANANKKFDKNHPDLQSEARDVLLYI
uniref:PDZ domain-containing protein n=1 Tax=Megaselia scalaris TaxID=36166 RepID=T1GBN7_MEGSC